VSATLDHVPGSLGLPLLGQTVPFVRDARALLERNRARHGDVFKVQVLGQPTVVFLAPEATRTIYLDREQVLSSERGWSFTIGPLFQRGLMLRDFDDHRLHRRAMSHAFRRVALDGYLARIHEVTDRRLARIGGGPVDVYALMKGLTLDIATEVFVGLDLGPEIDVVNDSFVAMMRASVSPLRVNVPGTPFHAGMAARRRLVALLGGLVEERRRAGEGSDLLSRLCHATTDDGRPLAADEVVDHMIFLLLAAHDTTTSTLAVMLWELAQHPDWQQRVAAEVAMLDGGPVTLENHGALAVTGRVMKEALRLSPPVPFSPRGVLADTEIDGVPVPAGTMITAASLGLHRHPAWWTAPSTFDPDRFAPDRAEDRRHSHSYVPFGGGAHLCIGNHFAELVVKAVLARLLAQHRVAARPGQTVFVQAVPIPKPRGGLVLTVS
jgi:cytochrome P450